VTLQRGDDALPRAGLRRKPRREPIARQDREPDRWAQPPLAAVIRPRWLQSGHDRSHLNSTGSHRQSAVTSAKLAQGSVIAGKLAPNSAPAIIAAAAYVVTSVAFAVGCSVVVLHRHYPSDVVGGWLVAGGWCFAVVAGLRADEELRSRRGIERRLTGRGA
jgi:PAP2 superfamily